MNLYELYDILSLDEVSSALEARRGHLVEDVGTSSSAVFIRQGKVEVRSESGVLLNVLSGGDVYYANTHRSIVHCFTCYKIIHRLAH